MIERIGRFSITRKLGEGGMGIVYAAHDPRLERSVAIKTLRSTLGDDRDRQRLWREARAAAKVNHPNICQLYEIDEEEGVLFLAMELLEGESLADCIARGPIPLNDSVQITLAILSALDALHTLGIVHRDLKPSNVFITPVGVKLLDFGLARPIAALASDETDLAITQVGTVLGTPRYMAPELWRGEEVGPAADLFAVGTLAYEMLSGRPAFEGDTLIKVCESVLTQEPPPIVGSAAVAEIDQIIHRALRKKPDARFSSAGRMAAALRAVRLTESGERIAPRRMKRLIGLPLRVLRPDPDTDFLAFSIPDAVTSSLSTLGSLAVRSSATASRFAGESLDLGKIASEADVDVVLSGTLMRSGDRLRVNTQLLEAPAGTVLWSQTFQATIDDLFELQDSLTAQLVESLAVPLSGRDRAALRHDAPSSAQAYEFYLRANQVAYDAPKWEVARDLYLKCLDLDPQYAPAWARLGRVYRALSIYDSRAQEENYEQAERALRRAIELNPDLSVAQNLYTYLEAEKGRAPESNLRLLKQASVRMNDPELFAGMVQSLRYCGLLDESIAAYERAVRVDPAIRSSVSHAYLMRGDYDRAIATNLDNPPFPLLIALDLAGRAKEAIEKIREIEAARLPQILRDLMVSTRSLMEGNLEECRPATERLIANYHSKDPCGAYYSARHLARLGDAEQALGILSRSVEGGFYVPAFLKRDPWLDSLRGTTEFNRIVERAIEQHVAAREAFRAAGGERVLGLDA